MHTGLTRPLTHLHTHLVEERVEFVHVYAAAVIHVHRHEKHVDLLLCQVQVARLDELCVPLFFVYSLYG
jgi:hypothetical protein